jgi:hypothetical protein
MPSGVRNLKIYEKTPPNGNWIIEYETTGGDYSVEFGGPDAEMRAREYIDWLTNENPEYGVG